MRDWRVEELEEQQADVRGGLSEAEVGVQAGLREREAEGVEEDDGLQLDEDKILESVVELQTKASKKQARRHELDRWRG